MANVRIPNFKIYAEGEPIPPVDPEDLKRRWNIKPPWTAGALQAAWSCEADSSAVSRRDGMVRTLVVYKLLEPWRHGEELDDVVFRLAATFPIRELRPKRYMMPGDDYFGFDPNTFIELLVKETGISHIWEPVATKVPEGERPYIFISANFKNQVPDDPEADTTREARDLVWNVWRRCGPSLEQVLSNRNPEHSSEVVSILFSNFLLDNSDVIRQIEDSFRAGTALALNILDELERRAQCQNQQGS